MVDREFRMKVSRRLYGIIWRACAHAYGRENKTTLSKDADEAFDAFVAGYIAGMRYQKRKRNRP